MTIRAITTTTEDLSDIYEDEWHRIDIRTRVTVRADGDHRWADAAQITVTDKAEEEIRQIKVSVSYLVALGGLIEDMVRALIDREILDEAGDLR